jgi:serine/threonine protein kinase
MTPERWRRIKEVFHAALDRKHAERRHFVDAACSSDETLKREVVRLLNENREEITPQPPLHQPAWNSAMHHAAQSLTVQVAPGTLLEQYRIERELGQGGMGVVYQACDTRLNRPVAIKFLSENLANEALRRRFQREAQLASALNHPHILTVHDAGELESRLYLVTEFVDGGTLREWLQDSRSWNDVLDLLLGVADGLAVAHAAGMLHRDVKPANILISTTGYAKVADFGLAKIVGSASRHGGPSIDAERTIPGAIIGTVPYMSPEQAVGGAVDARSDIFAFGVVLYEALAGHRPFAADSDLEVLQKIRSHPPAALPAHIPEGVRAVVQKALEKNPEDRYQSMREVVADLKRLQRGHSDEISQSGTHLQPVRQRWRPVAIVCSAAAVAALATLLWVLWKGDYFWRNPLDGARVERVTDFEGDEVDAAISPDGKLVAFVSDHERHYDAWICGDRQRRVREHHEGAGRQRGSVPGPEDRLLARRDPHLVYERRRARAAIPGLAGIGSRWESSRVFAGRT